MLPFIALFLCIAFSGILFWLKSNSKGGKSVPGPIPLPIFGNVLQIGNRPHKTFAKWAEFYGPIFGVKMGFKNIVIVSDHKLIKEIFNENASTGRMENNQVLSAMYRGQHGILNANASSFEAQRKFTTRTLRSFGFGKESMEIGIITEVQLLLDWLKAQNSSPISCHRIFSIPVINSLMLIVRSKRIVWENGKPAEAEIMEEFLKELLNVTSNGLFFAPFLKTIAPKFFGWNRYLKSLTPLLEIFANTIETHRATFDPTNLRDYVDHYLLKIETETNPKSSFYKDTGYANLLASHFDLFFLGSESSANIIVWTLLYLSENKAVQKRLQKEIDQVTGSTLPLISHRAKMPYCEAVITEILRINSAVPLGTPHDMISDLEFHGYHIPKGMTVFANIYAVHHDPEIWGDPEVFRPERFLNEDQTKFVRNEAMIPFSEGKRKCIGETSATDTIFLFVTSIFQQFDILPDPHKTEEVDFEPEFGMILVAKPFKIVFSPRNS